MNVAALASNILMVLTTLVWALFLDLVHIGANEEGTAGRYTSDLWLIPPWLPFAICVSFLIIVTRKINQARNRTVEPGSR